MVDPNKTGATAASTDWRSSPFLPLFVPGNRPDRLPKAANAGCDAVIADLEDAVANEEKGSARKKLAAALREQPLKVPVMVRVNGIDTQHFDADLKSLTNLDIAAIVLPKAEPGSNVDALRRHLPDGVGLVGLVETPKGLAGARDLARQCDRLAFGTIDFAGAIAAAHVRESLLAARSELVLASALAGAPQPIDGVTVKVDAAAAIEDDARYAASLGFGGKLLIHPAQIVPAAQGFAPSENEVDRAGRLIAATGGNAGRFEGMMVDKPVIMQALRTIEIANRLRAKREGH